MQECDNITLSNGAMQFSALALGEGPLVLLLHGFPDNTRSWRHQLPALAEAGYRAVAVQLRGYEPSSQADVADYSVDALASDVPAFLKSLNVEQCHLVGHDWGAAISYRAAALYPHQIRSLTTLAVPHEGRFVADIIKFPRQLALSWYMLFFQFRGLADYVVARSDHAFIRMLWRRWSPSWELPEDELEHVIETFRAPGVLRAALAYYRTALSPARLPLSAAARRDAGYAVPVPTLALTGCDDHCINTEVFREMMLPGDFPLGLEVVQVPDAGHFPHQEQPAAVNELLLNWLHQNNQTAESTT